MHLIETFYNALQTAVVITDARLKVVSINESLEHLLMTSGSQLVGQPLQTVFPDSDSLIQRIQTFRVNGEHFTVYGQTVHIPRWRKSIEVDFRATFSNVADGCHCVLELTDSSGAKRREHADKTVVQFASTRNVVRPLLHEVKNPLGGLKGASQLLQKQLKGQTLAESRM